MSRRVFLSGATGRVKIKFFSTERSGKIVIVFTFFDIKVGVNVVYKFLNRKFKGVRWMP